MKIKTPEFLQAEFFMRDEKVTENNLPLIKPSQVHADNILIIDAKNISTNPKVPIHIVGNDILTDADKPKSILEGIHSSVRVWQNYFEKNGIKFNSIKNVICIEQLDNSIDTIVSHTKKVIDIEQMSTEYKTVFDRYYCHFVVFLPF